jgi:hypothetical protein
MRRQGGRQGEALRREVLVEQQQSQVQSGGAFCKDKSQEAGHSETDRMTQLSEHSTVK